MKISAGQEQKKAPSRRRKVATESLKLRLITDGRLYIFSVLPSYFTVPFLSFWRVTSSLV